MADYIANVTFEYPLVIVSDVPPLRGRARRCLGGDIVVVTMPRTGKEYDALTLEVSFHWITSYQLQTLQNWWGLGRRVSFQADYVHGQAIIDPSSGIYDVQHVFGADIAVYDMRGTDSDYFDGKVKLQVLKGYRWA